MQQWERLPFLLPLGYSVLPAFCLVSVVKVFQKGDRLIDLFACCVWEWISVPIFQEVYLNEYSVLPALACWILVVLRILLPRC